MQADRPLTVLQMLPALHAGGVERGTVEIARYLAAHQQRSLVMSAGGRLVAQLTGEGSSHFDWPVGKKSLWTLSLVPRLRRFLIEQNVDILHLRSRMPAWIGYLAWRGMDPRTRPRLVTSVHGSYTVNAYSAVMTRGERVIAVSETIRGYILANYPKVNPEYIRLIHRGVDPVEFPRNYQPTQEWLAQWRHDYPQLAGKMLITLPGRITRWKGQADFIALIARLKQAGFAVYGLMVGGIDPKKQAFQRELEAKIRTLDLTENITITGHRSDLKEIMSVSNVVLSLSQSPEAFGRVVPEALSLGIPVAGYNHGGVGEVLQAWFPAGIVAPRDLDALQKTVQDCLSAPPDITDNQSFTLERMQSRTYAVYRELFAPQTQGR